MVIAVAVTAVLASTWLLSGMRALRPSAAGDTRHHTLHDLHDTVSIVIPARNEAASLPRLLASLGRLEPAAHEVIVVDDDSTDDTAAIAESFGASVVRTAPEAGWLGKPWACHTGAEHASGTHLLFLDADTWLAPWALGALLGVHGRRGGLLSVQPYHGVHARYEELSAYCNLVTMSGSGAFTPAATSAAAFGPCLLTTSADYATVGGHASVRADVIEDLRLARRYERAGHPVVCLTGGAGVRFRMYPEGLGQLVDGWTKNIAAGAGAAAPLPVIGTVLWVAAHAAISVAAGAGIVRWTLGDGRPPWLAVIAWAVIAVHLGWLLRRIGSFRLSTAVAFPVPLGAFLIIFARSALVTVAGGAVGWRGRPVRLGRPGR